jgi:hypothetical protein
MTAFINERQRERVARMDPLARERWLAERAQAAQIGADMEDMEAKRRAFLVEHGRSDIGEAVEPVLGETAADVGDTLTAGYSGAARAADDIARGITALPGYAVGADTSVGFLSPEYRGELEVSAGRSPVAATLGYGGTLAGSFAVPNLGILSTVGKGANAASKVAARNPVTTTAGLGGAFVVNDSDTANPASANGQIIPLSSIDSMDAERLSGLQSMLKDKGLYKMAVDGKAGPGTRRALAAYNRQIQDRLDADAEEERRRTAEAARLKALANSPEAKARADAARLEAQTKAENEAAARARADAEFKAQQATQAKQGRIDDIKNARDLMGIDGEKSWLEKNRAMLALGAGVGVGALAKGGQNVATWGRGKRLGRTLRGVGSAAKSAQDEFVNAAESLTKKSAASTTAAAKARLDAAAARNKGIGDTPTEFVDPAFSKTDRGAAIAIGGELAASGAGAAYYKNQMDEARRRYDEVDPATGQPRRNPMDLAEYETAKENYQIMVDLMKFGTGMIPGYFAVGKGVPRGSTQPSAAKPAFTDRFLRPDVYKADQAAMATGSLGDDIASIKASKSIADDYFARQAQAPAIPGAAPLPGAQANAGIPAKSPFGAGQKGKGKGQAGPRQRSIDPQDRDITTEYLNTKRQMKDPLTDDDALQIQSAILARRGDLPAGSQEAAEGTVAAVGRNRVPRKADIANRGTRIGKQPILGTAGVAGGTAAAVTASSNPAEAKAAENLARERDQVRRAFQLPVIEAGEIPRDLMDIAHTTEKWNEFAKENGLLIGFTPQRMRQVLENLQARIDTTGTVPQTDEEWDRYVWGPGVNGGSEPSAKRAVNQPRGSDGKFVKLSSREKRQWQKRLQNMQPEE